jgi:hypothetical protein
VLTRGDHSNAASETARNMKFSKAIRYALDQIEQVRDAI